MEYFVDSEAVWMIKRSEAENGKLESWSLHVVERHHGVCRSTPTLSKETNFDLWSFKIFQKITNVFSIIYYILSHCLEYTLILDLERQVRTLLEKFFELMYLLLYFIYAVYSDFDFVFLDHVWVDRLLDLRVFKVLINCQNELLWFIFYYSSWLFLMLNLDWQYLDHRIFSRCESIIDCMN